MPVTIGQTPDRESDKQRLPFRTEADTECRRAVLSCVYYEKTFAHRAESERRRTVKPSMRDRAEGTGEKIAGKVQEKIGQVKKVFGK
jgi:hypothetical protein